MPFRFDFSYEELTKRGINPDDSSISNIMFEKEWKRLLDKINIKF